MTLDLQLKEVIEAATQQLSAQVRDRLQALITEVSQAAAAERVSVVRELRMAAEAEIAKRSQEAVAASQADHMRRLEEAVAAARAEGARRIEEAVASARAEHSRRLEEAVASARAAVTREHETALASLRSDHARSLQDSLATARADHARQLEERVRDHEGTLEGVRAETERAVADAVARATAEANDRVARATAEANDRVARAMTDADDRLARVAAEADDRMAQAVRAARQEATAQAEEALVEARAGERQGVLAQIDRLSDAIRRMDLARTLTDVLDGLIDAAAADAPRSAIFLLRGSKMVTWRISGFGAEVDPRRIEVPITDQGLLGRALRSAGPVTSGDLAGDSTATPFGPLAADRVALTMPVRVGGEVVAVLYADDAGGETRAVPSAWPEVVEVLARHAARCLEVLTVTRVAQPAQPMPDAPQTPRYAPQQVRVHAPVSADDEDAARRYAKLLVSEIKLYHESAVAQGRRDRNLLERLKSEIDRARRLYDERVPAAIRTKTDYFGQELVRTLANGDAALLGTA
jgi:hypothetical protein